MRSRSERQRRMSAGQAAALGEPDRPVQRNPALEAPVGEVLAPAARLPDAFLGLVPVLAEPVHHVHHRGPADVRRLQPVLVGLGEGVHGLAEDVQLELAGRAVADPDRARAAPALPVVESLLGEVRGPVDPVHDPQRAVAVAAAMLDQAVPDPDTEGRCLLRVAQPEQRVYRERRVPDPGVAVVPVALAAGLLWQPGGGRRHQRPGRGVGHQLERYRRAGHHLAPAPGVGGFA